MTRIEDATWAALRIVAGFMFTFHGVQKILGLLSSHAGPPVGSQMWIGGLIELVGGALIALGLFTRPAAFLASGTMAVAYFQFHWKFEGGTNLLPIVNDGELSVLYCFVFLTIAAKGAGAASLDRLLRRA